MDEESKHLLREIRNLISDGNQKSAEWLDHMRALQERAVSYNRKAWLLSLATVLVPVLVVIAIVVMILLSGPAQ